MPKSKPVATAEEIENKVQSRSRLVRDMLGDDFPMIDWYIERYEDYFRKTQTIESLCNASQQAVYVINISDSINVALVAPIDADIEEETNRYPPLFEKDDMYGFILHLVRECGFQIMNTVYSFNVPAYLQAATYARQTGNLGAATVIVNDDDDKLRRLMENLSEDHMRRFTAMMKKTEELAQADFEATLTDEEKDSLKNHNKQIEISVKSLRDAIAKKINEQRAGQGQGQGQGQQQSQLPPRYTHDGWDISKGQEYTVLLSGYPSNEMMHRYVGIGTRDKMESISKDIQAALDAGIIDIPYCGTVPEAMRKSIAPVEKGKRGGIITWGFGPELYTFVTLKEARQFAAQYDHHYSETGYLLQ